MGSEKYTNERVVGHRVSAEIMVEEYAFSEKREEYVHIKEGDVDWSKGREVVLSIDELREIAERFCYG